MKELKREIKLWVVSILIGWIVKILPTDGTADNYWLWLSKMPEK